MLNIEKVPVTSSNIEAIGYDETTETLRIWFKAGSVYDYEKVFESTYEDFKMAESVGQYFGQHIKGKYKFKKI